MKIKSLKVKSFRNINGENNILEFNDSDIIFIFGQNNVGKSTFLRAYEYFVTPKKKSELSDFHQFDEQNIIEMEMVFTKEVGDEPIFDKKGLNRWVSDENEIRFRKTWNKVGAEGQKETFEPKENNVLQLTNSDVTLINALTEHQSEKEIGRASCRERVLRLV